MTVIPEVCVKDRRAMCAARRQLYFYKNLEANLIKLIQHLNMILKIDKRDFHYVKAKKFVSLPYE